ncbi:single-stranded DNA-binding protein [Spiroplasma endosymbiont of Polydrusus formosus]|uniref:single-stranded DNA-binding protein n=1 Tax=Spiroplasma endosymbiont of Polydrusus formosus TaxID=3139326 RepID=UPI0035B5228D
MQHKKTDFILCRIFNKQAIVLQKYCQKESKIAIIGVLQFFKNKDNKNEGIV